MDRSKSTDRGPYIGRSMPRFEDLRLVRGAGRYSDDISVPGQAYAVFVRSPHAHALIKRIDTAKARAMKGVVAVLAGADYVADGMKGALQRPNPAGAIDIKIPAFAPEKRPVLDERHYPVRDGARALSRRMRRDGDRGQHCWWRRTQPKQSRSNTRCFRRRRKSAKPSAANRSGRHPPPTTSRSIRSSATPRRSKRRSPRPMLVVEETFRNQRIVNAQMEPRSGVASYDAANDSYKLISGNQGVHVPRGVLAESFGVPERENPLHLPGRRRRFRAAQQSLSRAGCDPVGGEARPAGR